MLVVGGGVAGLQAALVAGRAGAKILLIEQTALWGGRAPADGVEIDGKPGDSWVKGAIEQLERMENVVLRSRCMGAGICDHGYVLADERLTDHAPESGGPRHRLWKIRARQVVTATGAVERPLAFPGNDVPGVMLASAMRDFVANWAVAPGRRIVIVTNNDDAYRTALALVEAGLDVPAILDARATAEGALPRSAREKGLRVLTGRAVVKVRGRTRVTGVGIGNADGIGLPVETIRCDAVAMSGGWSPVVHLWSHCGGKLVWDAARAQFRPDADRAPTSHDGQAFMQAAGAANGALHAAECQQDAARAGAAAARAVGCAAEPGDVVGSAVPEAALEPVWIMPRRAGPDLRMKMFLDYQNDVKVSDVQLAARYVFDLISDAAKEGAAVGYFPAGA